MAKISSVILLAASTAALENGLARTPPLGWVSWQRYRCATTCNDSTSADCLNEALVKRVADEMVAGGYRDAGYSLVALDDCWQAPYRVNGHVIPDPHRFPSGIDGLAKYVHAKGLKFGLYSALGNNTCAMADRPSGPLGLGCDFTQIDKGCPLAKQDIDDFAKWGIDHLKVDGCQGFDNVRMNESYALVGRFLNKTGRPIVYHPSNLGFRYPRQFRELATIANQWRWFDDVDDSWESVFSIIEEIGAGQPTCTPGPLPAACRGFLFHADSTACSKYCEEVQRFRDAARPGAWHDPDMLLLGNTPCSAAARSAGMHCRSLTHDEERTQLAIWALASAPLFVSNDLPNIPQASKALLLNRDVLAINQDPLGRMPFRYFNDSTGGTSGWRKELHDGAVAVALLNVGAVRVSSVRVLLPEVGFADDTRVRVRDVFANAELGEAVGSFVSPPIESHGALLLRLSYVGWGAESDESKREIFVL